MTRDENDRARERADRDESEESAEAAGGVVGERDRSGGGVVLGPPGSMPSRNDEAADEESAYREAPMTDTLAIAQDDADSRVNDQDAFVGEEPENLRHQASSDPRASSPTLEDFPWEDV
jgi:hypothetical protein